MNQIIKVCMERDGDTFGEAKERLKEAKVRVALGDNPEEVLEEDFGLEPDYIFDLLD